MDPGNPLTDFREASWEEALDLAASGLREIRDRNGAQALAGFGSAKGSNEEAYLVQKLIAAASARTTSTTARACAMPRRWRRLGEHRLGRGHCPVHRGQGRRRDHRDRRQSDREPSGRGDLLQAGGEAGRP